MSDKHPQSLKTCENIISQSGLFVNHPSESKHDKKGADFFMERFNARGIDELRRIALHSDIRESLGLKEGTKVILQPIGNIVAMQKMDESSETEYFSAVISELGRIEIPIELMLEMKWEFKDRIAVYYVDDGMVILKRV